MMPKAYEIIDHSFDVIVLGARGSRTSLAG
jgi:hypothetical protein